MSVPAVVSLRPKALLFVSDSIWHGYGVGFLGPRFQLLRLLGIRGWAVQCKGSQSGTYTGTLAPGLVHECYAGQGGPQFTAALTRISNVGAMGTGSVVIISLGANDIGGAGATNDRTAAQWASDMATIRDAAEAIADHVIVMPPYDCAGSWTEAQSTRGAEFAAIAPTLATAKTTVCLTYRSTCDFAAERQPSDNHLNEFGAIQRATAVYQHGVDNGIW